MKVIAKDDFTSITKDKAYEVLRSGCDSYFIIGDHGNKVWRWKSRFEIKKEVKKLKTWEMIKKLIENPEKKFKTDSDHRVGIDSNGVIAWEGPEDGVDYRFYMMKNCNSNNFDVNWTEVEKEVSFDKALEEMQDGKEMRSCQGDIYYIACRFPNDVKIFFKKFNINTYSMAMLSLNEITGGWTYVSSK